MGPLLVQCPALVPELRAWRSSRHLYVRRASAVPLIPLVRTGRALGDAYAAALALGAEEGRVKALDFGPAKVLAASLGDVNRRRSPPGGGCSAGPAKGPVHAKGPVSQAFQRD